MTRAAVRPDRAAPDPVLDGAHARERVPGGERYHDGGHAPAGGASRRVGARRRRRGGVIERERPVDGDAGVAPGILRAQRPRVAAVPDRRARGVAQVPGEPRHVAGQGLGPHHRACLVPDLQRRRDGLGEARRDDERIADAVGVRREEGTAPVQGPRDGGGRVTRGEAGSADVPVDRRPEPGHREDPGPVGGRRGLARDPQAGALREVRGGRRSRVLRPRVRREQANSARGHDLRGTRRLEVRRVDPGRRGRVAGHGAGTQPQVADDRAVEARRRRRVRIELEREARRALRREGSLQVTVRGRRPAEHLVHGPVRGEQRADLVRGRMVGVALGDHDACPGTDEPRAVVVDALARIGEGADRQAGLGIPGRVAEVVEQHDGVRRELDVVADVVLAVVDVARAVRAARRVEPEAVLRQRLERRVDARPAVAVAEVHEDVRALRGSLHVGPGRVGRDQLDDVGRVLPRRGGDVGRVGLVVRVVLGDRPHHDHDLGRRRSGRDRRGLGDAEDGEGQDGDGEAVHGTSVGASCPAEHHKKVPDPPGPIVTPPVRAGRRAPGGRRWAHDPPAGPHERGRPPRGCLRRARVPAVPRTGSRRGGLAGVDPGRERERHPLPAGARRRTRVLRPPRGRRPGRGPSARGEPRGGDPPARRAGSATPGARGGPCGSRLEPHPSDDRGRPPAGLSRVRALRAHGRGPCGERREADGGPGLGRGGCCGAGLPRAPGRADGRATGPERVDRGREAPARAPGRAAGPARRVFAHVQL